MRDGLREWPSPLIPTPLSAFPSVCCRMLDLFYTLSLLEKQLQLIGSHSLGCPVSFACLGPKSQCTCYESTMQWKLFL